MRRCWHSQVVFPDRSSQGVRVEEYRRRFTYSSQTSGGKPENPEDQLLVGTSGTTRLDLGRTQSSHPSRPTAGASGGFSGGPEDL